MTTQPITDEGLLGRPETAKRIACSLRTLDAKIKRREIPYVKIGKLIRFIPADVQKFIDDHRIA